MTHGVAHELVDATSYTCMRIRASWPLMREDICSIHILDKTIHMGNQSSARLAMGAITSYQKNVKFQHHDRATKKVDIGPEAKPP